MKNLLLAGLLACFMGAAHAQAQPKKGDNLVLIQTPDSAGVALKKLVQAFVVQGYTVEKYDGQFYTLTLAPKTLLSTFSPILLARASATNGAKSTLRLSGEYRAVVMNHPLNDVVEMKGSEKGIPTSGFRALEKVALTYPGGQVSYGKQ